MYAKLRNSALIIALAALSAGAQTFAPTKVAVINSQKAIGDTAEIKKASADLEAKYRPTQQQVQQLQTDLQNIQQQLNSPNLAPERESQLRADGTNKQRQLQRLQEDLQADLNNDRADILGRAGRQMTEVVRKIAEQHGIDVVIDLQQTLYTRPAIDITAEATAAYDKAYPAAK